MDTRPTFLDRTPDALRQVEALLTREVDTQRSPLEAALARLIMAGGKRLRPRIALLMGGLFAAPPAPLQQLAAAIEMLHTASLIHDDLVDDATLRRGVQTLNAAWSTASSVLTGDLTFTRAAALVLQTGSLPVVEMFTRTMSAMVEGELDHLVRPQDYTCLDGYYRWIRAKTATLFELAAGAPALLAGATPEAFAAARRFGQNLGMVFQIMDDMLDFTGDPVRLGKPVGNDLRHGVLTLPALFYHQANPEDADMQAVLLNIGLERPALQEHALEGLISRIRTSTAIRRALDSAQGFLWDALAELESLPVGPERLALAELAGELITREE